MAETVRLRLGNAELIGTCEQGVRRFAGIRYARAPVGDLRFSPPVALVPEGLVDAREPGPVAPQTASLLRNVIGDMRARQSEDCLHLTVWAPERHDRALPVVVWIHGGAWQSGGSSLPWYDGAGLCAAGGVVVVSVNYRLGPLGWLCADGIAPNLGLQDLFLAIRWVTDHIGAFGGDPASLTLMGQSAGAVNVAGLLAAGVPAARVILQSGPFGRCPRRAEVAKDIGNTLLRAAGARTADEARRLPVEALLQAQQATEVRRSLAAAGDGHGLFCPVSDGGILPDDFSWISVADKADVLVGTNRDEMLAFPGHVPGDEAVRAGNALFFEPSRQWATAARAAGRRAWEYRFDVAPSDAIGACHCVELPFVFGNWSAFAQAPMLQGLDSAGAIPVSQRVQQSWLAFMRGEAPEWPASPYLQAFNIQR